ncbi:phage major capsid protein [Mesorhizobium sp. B2-6-3]|uniref:phage major capsid protein n=1 Tax=Mesorhizobium sp. B2-6-3 TaxID=2589914 RepID=UPI0011265FA1|nr:phage major capsid protein [Mesorhizobium sp. B2-6-3]TPJ76201.1 phage major capsid protein [Mesorhizobium sp. B2-6-3]
MTVTRRAYSFLTIKAVNEEKRIITGIATTPAVDRVGDIVEPLGVKFNNPMPFLWQHDARKPIGTVKFDKPTKDGITFEAEIPQVEDEGTLRDRIEEAWQSIKLGLVRAVSIGFRAIEYSYMENNGGIRFTETEVYELSAVTIPAQSEAVITGFGKNMDAAAIAVIKQFDTGAPAATGHIQRPTNTPPGASGKSHKPVNLRPKEGTDMKTVAEQIAALEAKRAANAARMNEIQSKASEAGRTKDDAEKEEFGTLADEVDTIDEELKDLRRMEKAQVTTAKPVIANQIKNSDDGSAVRSGIVIKPPALAPGIAFARLARVKALAKLDSESPRTIAKELYGEDSPVFRILSKAAVAAATSTNATWAGPLVGDETSVFADFVEWLRPQTILGRFGANGIPSLRRVPFRVPLIGQTSGGNGYWVGEGKAKPLTKFDFERKTLEPLKVANIAVATMETLRDSSPSAEIIIRDQLAAALRERLDLDFIDPAKAASAGVSPASITNGITPVASTGNDADSVRRDIKALFAAFIADNNAPTDGVWIMPAITALALSLMQNPLGQAEFPGISMTGGTLFGLPVIVSQYVPTTSAGAYVALVNASDVYLADEGGIEVDMSTQASLQMDNAPTNASDTPTATSLVSLWQTNSVGFRAERTIDWMRRRAGGVALLSGVNWGDEAASG